MNQKHLGGKNVLVLVPSPLSVDLIYQWEAGQKDEQSLVCPLLPTFTSPGQYLTCSPEDRILDERKVKFAPTPRHSMKGTTG